MDLLWLVPIAIGLWAWNERRKRIKVERLFNDCEKECVGLTPKSELGVQRWYLREMEKVR